MEFIDIHSIIVYSDYMGKIKFLAKTALVLLAVFSCLTLSCATDKPAATTTQPGQQAGTAAKTDAFDPARVSQAVYISTREEVQHFIDNLNQIIRSRNFNAWKDSLSPAYYAEISSQENLRALSEQPAMKTRRIVLRVPEDYFIHVVVASRSDYKVDDIDIEFVTANRVKAFILTTNRAGEEVRLRLYDLEKINNTWTIIN